ncbi:DUF4429 domain-containing protein [Actinokineospora sp. NBRC 105648]|uniref:DUF4429 domain-containing protein n=1 Tax=Actinokineospora sp. NBRC 105648 TaxID=3032206 RepID=UPI0024A13B49|nr:DUF4429 domain-containing protein [Actinokineospora sp. NBRC 105648]GLZ37280.1 hypothetical protein Acsp05_09050 [Actinokineospora sp. NBRC 105648]
MLGLTELAAREGTWVFDYASIRITPGRGAHPLRQLLGEVVVPLAAIESITHEPDRKGGTLRLRPRAGADPLTQAVGGALPEGADPFRLAVEPTASASAETFASGVRDARLVAQVPDGPTTEYLLPGPPVPCSTSAADGTAGFDGARLRLEWGWAAESAKRSGGTRELALSELAGVEWTVKHVRFRTTGAATGLAPSHDPNCLVLWGFKKDVATSALLAAAVTARLPHPYAAAPAAQPDTDQDTVLRRLRELGELRRDGVLTDDEFTAAKQALLRRL